jgi:lipopolysaccharide export system protein LptA
MTVLRALALALAAALWSSGSGAASAEGTQATGIRVAVVPFEQRGLGESDRVDVAAVVAARLADRALERVVAPSQLKADPVARPEAGQVRDWARAAGVDSVVVGKVVPAEEDGQGFAVAAELRSGHSGATIARYRAEAPTAAAIGAAAESLSESILEGLGYQEPDAELPTVAARGPSDPPGAEGGADGEAESEEQGVDLDRFRSKGPIAIESDELELIEKENQRYVVFTHNVRVMQADVLLLTDQLEAFYPEGSSQPERFVASGRVRVQQGERRARCDRAVYLREDETVICSGRAELFQGCDHVRGQEIRFDLAGERVRVMGAPSVVIYPDDPEADRRCLGGLS